MPPKGKARKSATSTEEPTALEDFITYVHARQIEQGHAPPSLKEQCEALCVWQSAAVEHWRRKFHPEAAALLPSGASPGAALKGSQDEDANGAATASQQATRLEDVYDDDSSKVIRRATEVCEGVLSSEELRDAQVKLHSVAHPRRIDIDNMRRKFEAEDEEATLFDTYEFVQRQFFEERDSSKISKFTALLQSLRNMSSVYEEDNAFAAARGCHPECYALRELASLRLVLIRQANKKVNDRFHQEDFEIIVTLTEQVCRWYLTEPCGELCDELCRLHLAKSEAKHWTNAQFDLLDRLICAAGRSIPISDLAKERNMSFRLKCHIPHYEEPQWVKFCTRERSPDTVGELLLTNLEVPPSQLSRKPSPSPNRVLVTDATTTLSQAVAVGQKRPRPDPFDLVTPTPRSHTASLFLGGATSSQFSPAQRSSRGKINPDLLATHPCRSKYHSKYAKDGSHGSSTCRWCTTCHMMEILFNGCTRDCAFKHGQISDKKISTHLKMFPNVHRLAMKRWAESKSGKRLDPVDLEST